ncbi:MAG TPA: hypothetical protein PL018_12340 [Ignavibacteriaceae bacterium]|nr:hypothetical protein [Ignavibacteriaceae bacterium]
MSITQRLNKIEYHHNIKGINVHVIYINKIKNETKEQAVLKYEAQHNINSETSKDAYVFILIPSNEEIRMRSLKNKT